VKKLLSAILAVGVSFAPLSSAFAQVNVGVGPVGVHVGHDHDRDHDRDRDRDRDRRDHDHDRFARRDHDRGCHMVIIKSHRDGMTVTRRIRHCD
jgi:Ni/Co efflux regulator RcnB